MKCKNIHRIGIPEGEEEQGIENLFEKVMMENFRTFMREKFTQIQEATKRATIKRATIKRVTIKRNTKKPTTRHIVIKMAKFQEKERILKAARKKTRSNIQRSANKISS